MSIKLMNVVMGDGMDYMPTTERFVLLMLADAANDDGVTWIPIKGRADKRSLMKKTSLSERGVQNCLRTLEADKHITRDERPGRGVMYTIHPRTRCTPASNTPPEKAGEKKQPSSGAKPPHDMHPRTGCTGASDARTPARHAPKPYINQETPLEPDGSKPPQGGDDDAGSKKKADRGQRISADWQPPAVIDLPRTAKAKAMQWPVGAYEAEAEAFRDYWLGEGRAGARKMDWNRAWANRINECTARVLRDHKAGVRFTPTPVARSDAAPPEVLDTSRECQAAKAIRAALTKRLGDKPVQQWFAGSRLDVVDGVQLFVVAPSQFASNYQRDNYADDVARAMHAVLGPDADLSWRVERPPAP